MFSAYKREIKFLRSSSTCEEVGCILLPSLSLSLWEKRGQFREAVSALSSCFPLQRISSLVLLLVECYQLLMASLIAVCLTLSVLTGR